MIGSEYSETCRRSVGHLVTMYRQQKGWYIPDLARELAAQSNEPGRDYERQVRRLEAGEVPDTIEVIASVARALGKSVFDFVMPTVGDAGLEPQGPASWNAWGAGMKREMAQNIGVAARRPMVIELANWAMHLSNSELEPVLAHARNTVLAKEVPADARARALTPLGVHLSMTGRPLSQRPVRQERADGKATKARKR